MLGRRIFDLSIIEKKLDVLFGNSKAIFWGGRKRGVPGSEKLAPTIFVYFGPLMVD